MTQYEFRNKQLAKRASEVPNSMARGGLGTDADAPADARR